MHYKLSDGGRERKEETIKISDEINDTIVTELSL